MYTRDEVSQMRQIVRVGVEDPGGSGYIERWGEGERDNRDEEGG